MQLNIVIFPILVGIGLFSFVGFGQLLVMLLKSVGGQYDELERKVVFDSLGISMILIFLIHLLQFAFGIVAFNTSGDFTPIIGTWSHMGQLLISVTEMGLTFENIFFDALVIGLVYFYLAYKYKLKELKQIVVISIVTLIIVIVLIIGLFFRYA